MSGDEIDKFACEVAKLSLILADYPNHNGWDIRHANLFANMLLRERISPNTYVICNPPFQDFEPDDRATALGRHDVSKPVAILTEVIAAEPAGIGFVLASTFILGERYHRVRAVLEQTYRSVEIVEIPDDVFAASRAAASLLIAKDRRSETDGAHHHAYVERGDASRPTAVPKSGDHHTQSHADALDWGRT